MSGQVDEFQMHPFTLAFPEEQERDYREAFFRSSLREVHLALLLAILFYGSFGILDAFLVPGVKRQLWIIRFGVFLPITFLVFLFSFTGYFRKYMQACLFAVMIVSGLGIIAMILIAPDPGRYFYYAGLILVLFYGYTFLKLRFIWATAAGWILVAAYEIAAVFLHPTPSPVLVNNNFFFLASNIIGMAACYSIEFRSRKDFILARAIEEEKKKVATSRRGLKKRVSERTAQLTQSLEELKREIAEREKAEEERQRSERRFQSLSENSPEIIYTLDMQGAFSYLNPAWEEILGYRRVEAIGRHFISFAREQDKVAFVRHFKSIRDEKRTLRDVKGVLIHRDGTNRLFTLSGAPNLDGQGRVIGMVGLMIDITEQTRLQDRLEQAKKMEAIGSLAGGVAHDLNNVLAGIVGYPDVLLMEIPRESPLRKPLLAIRRSGEKASAIVQDLLTLARRGVSTAEVVDLNDIVEEYLRSPEYEKLKTFCLEFDLETSFEKDLLRIIGSPIHISKTIMNLVINALEAMPCGGKVVLKTENRRLERPVEGYEKIKEGEYAVFSISDTGIGIAPQDLRRIFEPFYTKKTMNRSGTGLGMAVVWGTMKDHEGFVDVKSEEGKGTEFILYFPATDRKPAEDPVGVSLPDYLGSGESVLVVDDAEEQREIATLLLTRLGYRVTCTGSGEEAVEYVKGHPQDLILLDMLMDPGMDGLETYKRILDVYPTQKAVIASGYSCTERVREAQRLGAGGYLKKPYTLEKIGLAVKAEFEKGGDFATERRGRYPLCRKTASG
jgi:PAS domain S-box-containing protein